MVKTHRWVERCWSMKNVFTQKWNSFPLFTYRGLFNNFQSTPEDSLHVYLPMMFMMSSLIFWVKSILTSPTISRGFWSQNKLSTQCIFKWRVKDSPKLGRPYYDWIYIVLACSSMLILPSVRLTRYTSDVNGRTDVWRTSNCKFSWWPWWWRWRWRCP